MEQDHIAVLREHATSAEPVIRRALEFLLVEMERLQRLEVAFFAACESAANRTD